MVDLLRRSRRGGGDPPAPCAREQAETPQAKPRRLREAERRRRRIDLAPTQPSQSIRHTVLCAALLLVSAACGGADREPPRTAPDRGPAAATADRDDRSALPEEEPREISTDRALAADPGAGTPEREASLRIVEEGKGYLIAGQAGEAARRFEHATRIDPTNGFAYYYLGRARIENGERARALGVLEKAETLLGPYPEWRERAAGLLAAVR